MELADFLLTIAQREAARKLVLMGSSSGCHIIVRMLLNIQGDKGTRGVGTQHLQKRRDSWKPGGPR